MVTSVEISPDANNGGYCELQPSPASRMSIPRLNILLIDLQKSFKHPIVLRPLSYAWKGVSSARRMPRGVSGVARGRVCSNQLAGRLHPGISTCPSGLFVNTPPCWPQLASRRWVGHGSVFPASPGRCRRVTADHLPRDRETLVFDWLVPSFPALSPSSFVPCLSAPYKKRETLRADPVPLSCAASVDRPLSHRCRWLPCVHKGKMPRSSVGPREPLVDLTTGSSPWLPLPSLRGFVTPSLFSRQGSHWQELAIHRFALNVKLTDSYNPQWKTRGCL